MHVANCKSLILTLLVDFRAMNHMIQCQYLHFCKRKDQELLRSLLHTPHPGINILLNRDHALLILLKAISEHCCNFLDHY